ncbi:MAG TPA: hypothetical protein VGI52_08025 [Solirubrobacteraceae bacterium]
MRLRIAGLIVAACLIVTACVIASAGARTSRSTPARAAQPFQLRVNQRNGTITVRVAPHGSNARWRAYLNGRDITASLGYVPPSGRSIVISASNGARFGRNKLVLRLRYPHGKRRIARSFTVSRGRPLPAAGADIRLLGPAHVRLSAGASRAARGGALRYRWTIARKPAGSHARLLSPRSQRPRLMTDVSGTYTLRLQVRGRRVGGAGFSQPSTDLVQVQQSAAVTQQGAFVAAEGLTPSAGKLRVSGGPFAGTYALGTGAPSADVAMFFDRSTMEPLPRSHVAPYLIASNRQGAETLSAALAAAQKEATELGHTVGMLLVATNAGGYSSSFGKFLTSTVKVAGVPLVGASTPFALYAVPGVAGSGWVSIGSGVQREFAGLLAPDDNGNLSFAPSSVPSLGQTVVSYATTPNGITVNGSSIASGADKPCASASGGYQVRILEAATLGDITDSENGHTFWTNGCGDNTGAVEADAVHGLLARAALASGLPARLVIVQGVGVPQHPNIEGNETTALREVAAQVKQLGGSAEAFDENADATSGPSYALLGKNFQTGGVVGSSDSSPAEVMTAAPTPKKLEAALSGTFERDRQWRFVVAANVTGTALSGATGAAFTQLQRAAQTINPSTLAPTPFPTEPDWLQMSDYTARQYGYTDTSVTDDSASLCAPMPKAPAGSGHEYEIDVRDLYCGGRKSQGKWSTNATDLLVDVNDRAVRPPQGISKEKYVAFLTKLQKEGALVDNVNELTSILIAPFGTQGVKANISLSHTAEVINQAVAKARKEQREAFEKANTELSSRTVFALFGELLTAAQTVVGLFTDGALPAITGLAGVAANTASLFANEQNGLPVLGPFVAGTEVAQIGQSLVAGYVAFDEGLERTRNLIVSDWARLQATDGISNGEQEGAALEQALNVSSNQFIWRTLLGSLFTPTRLRSSEYNPAPLDARNFRCPVWGNPPFESENFSMYFWRPWGNQATFRKTLTNTDRIQGHNNLAPLEGTYIALGSGEAYVLSAGGYGRPYKSYTNRFEVPPYEIESISKQVNQPPQNLPFQTFAPLFATPTQATVKGAIEGAGASPQGIDKQQLFPQLIRAAEEGGRLETLECREPSQEIRNNGVEGYEELTEQENRVVVGTPTPIPLTPPGG